MQVFGCLGTWSALVMHVTICMYIFDIYYFRHNQPGFQIV